MGDLHAGLLRLVSLGTSGASTKDMFPTLEEWQWVHYSGQCRAQASKVVGCHTDNAMLHLLQTLAKALYELKHPEKSGR